MKFMNIISQMWFHLKLIAEVESMQETNNIKV
jgi:hypothetical protein